MPEKVLEYAKFIIAIIGVTATTALGLIPEESSTRTVLTIIAAVATALLVAIVPNKKPEEPPKPTQLPA
jgi:RsiW-degrading membrane proteinase PrsW (M82 family)